MSQTSIEWADHSINPIRARVGDQRVGHYCEKVSPGCAHCYASALQPRFGMPTFDEARVARGKTFQAGHVFLDESKLEEVIRRRKPTRYFWADMSDMFGPWVPDEWIDRCFATMALTPQHTHLVLTKRADRMRDYITKPIPGVWQFSGGEKEDGTRVHLVTNAAQEIGEAKDANNEMRFTEKDWLLQDEDWPLKNVWLGVSAENQQLADERIPLLLQTPAAVRFVSAEPLIGPIDLRYLQRGDPPTEIDAVNGTHGLLRPHRGSCDRLEWVIVGGESGPQARPCDVAWVRSLVAQCKAAGVPAFVKQLGAVVHASAPRPPEWPSGVRTERIDPDGCVHLRRVQMVHRKGGDPSEWPEDLRVREYPA